MRRVRILAIGVWALVVVCGAGAPPGNVVVQPGESIQRAIDLAPPGAAITLAAGAWEENLVIGKPLTLRGAGAAASVIHAREPGQPVIRITANGPIEVQIQGLTAGEGRFAEPYENHGVLVEGKARLTLVDCAVVGNEWHGVLIRDEAQAVLIRCWVTENWIHGVAVDGGQAFVTGCTVEANGAYGIGILFGPVTIERSTVRGNGSHGIAVAGGACAVTITGCTIDGNGWSGVQVGGLAELALVENRILQNGEYGVALYEGPCSPTEGTFGGRVSGGKNAIPSQEDAEGNRLGAVCPPELHFLLTEDGGALDRGP